MMPKISKATLTHHSVDFDVFGDDPSRPIYTVSLCPHADRLHVSFSFLGEKTVAVVDPHAANCLDIQIK